MVYWGGMDTPNAKLTHRRMNVTKVSLCLDTVRFSSEHSIRWKVSSVYAAFKVSAEHGNVLLTAENRSTRITVSPSDTRSTTDPTWIGLGLNPFLFGGRPTNNGSSHSYDFLKLKLVPVVHETSFPTAHKIKSLPPTKISNWKLSF